jgi:phage recombination protein Bet
VTALATLPKSSDTSTWTPEERALVEAAGLVHTDAQSGTKTLAERPVVAAFLQHCARTGLDPIARQIYSIARKSKGQLKWQIQISIDGARLVAERTGQYEGQTTPEFTADGVTWTQVWLSPEPPKAARVGVYRRGFREALYAVALWDAYVQTKYTGEVSDMWSKMGPLMLAKCAEMLALRKAFPQDLSGLYSAEEMDQASAPTQAGNAPQADAHGRSRQVQEAAAPADGLEYRHPSKDWLVEARACRSRQELRPVFQASGEAGDLNVAVVNPIAAEDGQPEHISLQQYLWGLRNMLPDEAPAEDVVDAELVDEPVTEWPTATIPNGDRS